MRKRGPVEPSWVILVCLLCLGVFLLDVFRLDVLSCDADNNGVGSARFDQLFQAVCGMQMTSIRFVPTDECRLSNEAMITSSSQARMRS